MDYDENDFQGQNLHLAGEGSSKVSPVLRPYSLPKFEFDDNLQGHLRFDSLVDNEVFLGITSQEDNQWIEEYSRGSSGIEFSSSVAESRRNNVWSEATSSESVEMLLKSVGQEERVVGDTITEELDPCDEPGSLTKMDPNVKQDDGKAHVIHAQEELVPNELQENFSGFNVSSHCEQSHVSFTLQSQKAQMFGGELESVVPVEKSSFPLAVEEVDRKPGDENQKKAENLAKDSLDSELLENWSAAKLECKNMGSSQNSDAKELKGQDNPQEGSQISNEDMTDLSKKIASSEDERSVKSNKTSMDDPIGSTTAIVETCTYSLENPPSFSTMDSGNRTSVEACIPVNDEPTDLLPIGSPNLQTDVCSAEPSQDSKCVIAASPIRSEVNHELDESMHEESFAISPNSEYVELQEVQDGNTKSEILDIPQLNVNSPSKVSHMQSPSVDETDSVIERDPQQVTSDASLVSAGNNLSEMGEGSSINNIGTSSRTGHSSAELLVVKISNEDAVGDGNNPKLYTGDSNDEDQILPTKPYYSVQVNDEFQSSEPGSICTDRDVTSDERTDASLPSGRADMDIEVVGTLDSQKPIESSSPAEGCVEIVAMAQGSEDDTTVITEPVAAVESDKISSRGTSDSAHLLSGSVAIADLVTDDQPKSPILGVSLVHHDTEEKADEGFLSEGHSKNDPPQVESTVACASEGPLSVVEKAASPDRASEGHFALSPNEHAMEADPGRLECSKTVDTSPLRCDSSAKPSDDVETGGLLDPKGSMTEGQRVEPVIIDESQSSIDVASPSACDANHKVWDGGSSSTLDKSQFVSPSGTGGIELSQSSKDIAKDATYDHASLPKVMNDMDEKAQSVSSVSATKEDKSFTFEVSPSIVLGQASKSWQSFPAIQACTLSMNMEASTTNSSSNPLTLEQSQEVSLVSPPTPSSVTTQGGGKGNSERKRGRKSGGKENAKKGNRLKDTTPAGQSGKVEESSASLTPPVTGHVIQLEELKPKENVELSITKPSGVLPSSTSNLPDLNNSTSMFQQPFTDNQQVQLRAQILVYGSLISGTPPEEPHMIAAFAQSDGGRRTWEAAWHACLERVHGQKSQANNPDTPTQSRADVGNRAPDSVIKHGSIQSKVMSSPMGGASNKGTPSPVVSPMIPLSSPLWNISTPSCDGFPSSGVPRSALLDYHQALSPLHPYQTPPGQNFGGHNTSWLSHSAFPGQWLASSQISPFNVGSRFSALPLTEAVKLTPVKDSGAPGMKHTSSIPVVYSAGPGLSPLPSSLAEVKNATASSGQPASDAKSRKRKKVTTSLAINQTSIPSQARIASVTTPVVFHLPHPRTEGHTQISLFAQNQTDSVTPPVVTSLFPTSNPSPGPSVFPTSNPSPGPSVFPGASLLSNAKKVAASSGQSTSDLKSRKRKNVAASVAVNPTFGPNQAQVASATAPAFVHLPQVPHTEGNNQISLFAQNLADSATAPVVSTLFPTAVAISTPASITSKSSSGGFLMAVSPTSTHVHPKTGDQNMKTVISEETLSKVEESKQQAEDAAMCAAAAVSHCQSVWSQLERQRNSGLVSDDEAKLVSSAVSIAAAASVAKVAAAAAKIASNVAEQARMMADEVSLSGRTENFDQSSMISLPNVVNKFDKATPGSILKSGDGGNQPNLIISAAREAAKRRIEAASAASKHAENLDAIVKAAELAAEAVSQAGKIVAMGDPLPLKELVEAGPESYWKSPRVVSDKQGVVLENLNSNSNKKNVEAAPNVSDKEIQTLKRGLSPQTGVMVENQMMVVDSISGSIPSLEKEPVTPRAHKGPDLSKTIGAISESEISAIHTSVGQNMPQSTSVTWKGNTIKEGSLVEVYKDDLKHMGAWYTANVLSLKDGKALVGYTEISSDEGSEQLKEWIPLEVEGTEAPKIRIPHPMTTMRFEGTRKRRRTAVTDYAWSGGDRVDVWVQDCWREGVVMETNKIDVTSLTVQFPAQGETSIVRSWHVRPTLIWKDGMWIQWSSLKGVHSSQGDTPNEKRPKLGSPPVDVKRNIKSSENVSLVDSGKHEESRILPLSAQESLFNVGKSSREEKKLNTHRTMRGGPQKEGPRVVFGVPKPGKKQKFMDVSKHYVADRSNKNTTTNDSVKFTRYLMPQAPPRGWKNSSRNDAREKQVAETKSRVLKSRKPPVPSSRSLAQKDNKLASSKHISRDNVTADKTVKDHVSDDENLSGNLNQIESGPSFNTEDSTEGPALASSLALPSDVPKKGFTKSEHLNKGKLAGAGGKAPKTDAKDKSIPEAVEPRRSNRKIQPTSRLLEGLQSSLTIAKMPSVSHSSQRSHSKVTSKGNTERD